jgi:hypothetical protein
MACSFAGATGFLMLFLADTFSQPWVGYAGLCIANSGAVSNVAITTVWLTDALTDSGEIALYTAVMVTLGNCGGVTGPNIYGQWAASKLLFV